MPEREIKTSIGTYINEDGVSEFGFKGDKVQVHDKHVKRFDELNVDSGDPVEYERVGVEVITPTTAEGKPAVESEDDDEDESKTSAKKAPAKKAN